MKHYQMQLVNTVVDRVCDECRNSVMIDLIGHKYEEVGELKATWGYGSKEVGASYHLDLCEACFKFAVAALKEHKCSVMLDKNLDLPEEDFGIDKSYTPN
jgi:hypothetical protein